EPPANAQRVGGVLVKGARQRERGSDPADDEDRDAGDKRDARASLTARRKERHDGAHDQRDERGATRRDDERRDRERDHDDRYAPPVLARVRDRERRERREGRTRDPRPPERGHRRDSAQSV